MLKSLGCGGKDNADPEAMKSKTIDRQLRKEKKKYTSTYRLLLLGRYLLCRRRRCYFRV